MLFYNSSTLAIKFNIHNPLYTRDSFILNWSTHLISFPQPTFSANTLLIKIGKWTMTVPNLIRKYNPISDINTCYSTKRYFVHVVFVCNKSTLKRCKVIGLFLQYPTRLYRLFSYKQVVHIVKHSVTNTRCNRSLNKIQTEPLVKSLLYSFVPVDVGYCFS